MTRATNLHDKTQQLLRDGYCVLERILTPEMLVRVLDASEGLIAASPPITSKDTSPRAA